MLPRRWSPCPPQLAAERRGTVTLDQSGDLSRWYGSSNGCSVSSFLRSTRFLASSSSDSVSGPPTSPPVFGLTNPLFPRPCCTVITCFLNQLPDKAHRITQ